MFVAAGAGGIGGAVLEDGAPESQPHEVAHGSQHIRLRNSRFSKPSRGQVSQQFVVGQQVSWQQDDRRNQLNRPKQDCVGQQLSQLVLGGQQAGAGQAGAHGGLLTRTGTFRQTCTGTQICSHTLIVLQTWVGTHWVTVKGTCTFTV